LKVDHADVTRISGLSMSRDVSMINFQYYVSRMPCPEKRLLSDILRLNVIPSLGRFM